MEDLTNTFAELLNNPESLEVNMPMLERFVIIMYDRTSAEEEINTARKIMFAQKGRGLTRFLPQEMHWLNMFTEQIYMLHLHGIT